MKQSTRLTFARFEVRHRRWFRRATSPFTNNRVCRGLFPYGTYALGACVFLLPYLAVLAGAAYLIAPTAVEQLGATVTDDPILLAALGAGAYALSLIWYRPIDKNDYGPDGNSTPTNYEEFESLMTAMGFSAFPISYFLLLRFEAEAAVYLDPIGLSAFQAALCLLVIGPGLVYAWLRHRYKHKDTRVCPELATFWGGAMFYVPISVLYLAQIPLGFDLLLYGSASDPVGATFAPAVFLLAFTMRRLRWTVNEDYFGFPTVNPFVPVWGVPRVVFIFGLAAVWLGAPLSELVVGACLAPMAGGVLYIGWRAYVSGDLKPAPHGWISSPGRKTYEKNRKKNNQKANDIVQAAKAVDAFNSFASKHDLSTLEEPSITNYNPKELKESLKTIHEYEARALSGDDYSTYMERRQAVLDEL